MRLVNAQPKNTLTFWMVSRPKRSDWRATIIVKSAYRLTADGVAIADESQPPTPSGDDPAEPGEAMRYASDFVPFKPNADFLVAGIVHAPNGTAVERCRVSIAIGKMRKSLVAIGDRNWIAGAFGVYPGPPAPFVTLPISSDRAFGGPGDRRNPLGRGIDPRPGRALPNIERPDQLITQSLSNPDPAGFGPIPPTWKPRIDKLGSFDSVWQKTRWPWLPADFHWSFFNAAPPDQQCPHFRGDEQLAFENLHPNHARLNCQLPCVAARVFVERGTGDASSFTEVPVKLDTVWVDVAAEKLVLVWRGVTPVASPRLHEIATIFTTLEPLDTPRDASEHLAVLAALRQAETPSGEGADAASLQARMAQQRELIAKPAAELSATLADISRRARAIVAMTRPTNAPVVRPPEDPMAALEKAIADLKARDPVRGQQVVERLEKLDQRIGVLNAMTGPESKWTRERVSDALGGKETLVKARLDRLDLSGLDFTGADLTDATLTNANLQNAIFDKAKLVRANFTKADLKNARFIKADVSNGVFSDSLCNGVTFAGANIEAAVFGKLNLTGTDFGSTVGRFVDFTGATLDQAYFARSNLPHARFTGIKGATTDFSHAILLGADFSRAEAPGIIMVDADLTNLRASYGVDFSSGQFSHARATRSIWQQTKLDHAVFTRATLTEAQFPEAGLTGANFDRANLAMVCFDDAILSTAKLTNANLIHASFERTDLTAANLDGANLYSAGFLDAIVQGASFCDCFVVKAQLSIS